MSSCPKLNNLSPLKFWPMVWIQHWLLLRAGEALYRGVIVYFEVVWGKVLWLQVTEQFLLELGVQRCLLMWSGSGRGKLGSCSTSEVLLMLCLLGALGSCSVQDRRMPSTGGDAGSGPLSEEWVRVLLEVHPQNLSNPFLYLMGHFWWSVVIEHIYLLCIGIVKSSDPLPEPHFHH